MPPHIGPPSPGAARSHSPLAPPAPPALPALLSLPPSLSLFTDTHRTPPHAERVERCLRAGPPRGDKQVRPSILAENTPPPPCRCRSVHTPTHWCHWVAFVLGASGGAGSGVVDRRSAFHPAAVHVPSFVVPSCVDRAQAGGASHPGCSALRRLCPVHLQGKGQVATWPMWG